jgi:multidrug efflux pump subunit AcrA (membrane-fusion protein)
MKRTIAVVVITVVALVGAVFAVRTVFFDNEIVATGYLQPVAVAQLNFGASAPVTELLVDEDERVHAGQVLARQDTSALEAQLAAHQATLAVDQVALAYQQDPTTPPELQGLQLATTSAQAQLDAARQKAAGTAGVDDALVTSAAGAVDTARAALAADQAQAASMASSCSAVTAAGAAAGVAPEPAPAAEFSATGTTGVPITLPPPTVAPVNTQLLSVCNDLARRLTTGQAHVADAEHDYQVAQARRDLNASTASASIDSAQQQLAVAVNRQAIGLQPATPESLAAAQAAVAQDTIAIAELRKQVDAAVLVAPRDGVVRNIGGDVGEVAGPEGVRVYGSPQALPQKGSNGINLFPEAPKQPSQQTQQYQALITLDSEPLQVVAQVPESSVDDLRAGQHVTVAFPALDDQQVDGHIARIEPEAVNNDGDVSFLVDVALDEQPRGNGADGSPRLVGITANIRF